MTRNIIIGTITALLSVSLIPPSHGTDDLLGQSIKKFRYPNYDNQGQLKMEVAGNHAQVLPQGLIKIADLNMTFYEEGKKAMTIATPVCLYDRLKQTATSKSRVFVTRSEIKISGIGFDWNENDGVIRINDNSRVVMQKTEQKSNFETESTTSSVPSNLDFDTNNTVITSTTLTYDQKKSMAIFKGNVVVTDPDLKISSDRLTVSFLDDKKVKYINAEGNVLITRGIIYASAKMASYDLQEGKITLWGKPGIIRLKDILTAESIVFWRNSDRIICEPKAHLIIYSDNMNDSFTGY